jgi:hypothetical protein
MMIGTRIMKWLLRFAILCSWGPLLAGIATVMAYYFVDSSALESLGGLTILAGWRLFLPGLVSLIVYRILGRLGKGDIARASWVALLILFLNFPAAFVCTLSAGWISGRRYRVYIENRSGEAFSDIRLDAAGKEKSLADVPGGESDRKWFYVRREGQLILRGTLGDTMIDEVLDDTLVRDQGETLYVTIDSEGRISSQGPASGS